MADVAFDLAEDYGDFQNLALLCIHPGISSSSRIEGYLDRYREDFASELYHLYIKNRGLLAI
jgi:nuclear pore complex protein Nup133